MSERKITAKELFVSKNYKIDDFMKEQIKWFDDNGLYFCRQYEYFLQKDGSNLKDEEFERRRDEIISYQKGLKND